MLKGYYVDSGYMGWIEAKGRYMLFASESDYREWVSANYV